MIKIMINNDNNNYNIKYSIWTEWSTIQGVIAQVISKFDKCKVPGGTRIWNGRDTRHLPKGFGLS